MNDISDNVMIQNISGDVAAGGWKCSLTTAGDTDILESNQEVQISWRPSLGGNFGSPLPAFNGHITGRKIKFTGTQATTLLEARTTDALLQSAWVQGIHFRDVGADSRANYHEFDDATGNLTLGRIVQHILGYLDGSFWISHTNCVFNGVHNASGWINIDDVEVSAWTLGNTMGSMRADSYIVEETSNIWRTIQQIAGNEFFVAYFDKLNNFHYKRHPMFQSSLPDPVMTLTKDHLIEEPEVEERPEGGDYGKNDLQIVLHAVTDEGTTLHSYSPAQGELRTQGQRKEISYIRCNDQNTLDFWARRVYDFESRDVSARIVLPGMSGLLFNLLDRVAITYVGSSYTGLDINWSAKKFWVHKIDVTPVRSVLTLEAENTTV